MLDDIEGWLFLELLSPISWLLLVVPIFHFNFWLELLWLISICILIFSFDKWNE
jgi:putative exporter of polyketide antibiotics